MKISIRLKFTAFFALALGLMIVASVILNNVYLENYYIRSKTETMMNAYYQLEGLISTFSEENTVSEKEEFLLFPNGTLWGFSFPSDETAKTELEKLLNTIQESSGITAVVLRERTAVTADGVDVNWIIHILNEKRYNYENDNAEQDVTLERGNSYQIVRTYDSTANTYYLEGWGYLSDGSMFLMRTPLASIKESAGISNQFYIYTGIVVLFAGTILMFFLMGYITKPIVGLTKLSKRMSQLDFEAKYQGKVRDEIGELGLHINEMSERLEETIAKLKSANLELQKDLEQKDRMNEMRNEFLSNVSHELKTPLALIQGYAEGIAEGISDDPESLKDYCDVIIDEAGKMNRMVKNLLSLNQLEFGKEQLELERFDMVALVQGVVNVAEILARQKEATIIFTQYEPIYVWGDEYRLEEVVTNYISNAIHHVSGKLEIEISVTQKEKTCRVEVFNTGKPIPEEDLDRIWEKFYKVDKARTREYGGNGIGLSIVKAVMEIHRGSCGVENRENGVLFWFELTEPEAV